MTTRLMAVVLGAVLSCCALDHVVSWDVGTHPVAEIVGLSVSTNAAVVLPTPPNRVYGQWTTNVRGAAGATAVVVDATLTFAVGSEYESAVAIVVEPTTIALIDGSASVTQRMVSGAEAVSHGDRLGEICVAPAVRLDITLAIDGMLVHASSDGWNSCSL